MNDSLEDRIHRDGNHPKFILALKNFRKSNHTRRDQQVLYDALEALGANPEEADEFVNMELENLDDLDD